MAMRLRRLTIKNFRNLVDVAIPIADTTILVGENNVGKTAFLDALKAALPAPDSGGPARSTNTTSTCLA
jgi:putative ATP-dependent endonuclease of OLD family